jgi:tetratricopeptide (TPR) repeat protein
MRFIVPATAILFSLIGTLCAQDTLPAEWRKARNLQDRATLERVAADARAAVDKHSNEARALYMSALAESLRAEVMAEQKDKHGSGEAAEAGIKAAKKAVALSPTTAEYHRLLGSLCGQTIPANPILSALSYGHCALDEVNKALQIDPRSSMAWMSKAVGNYYLPAGFGGGADQAAKDIEKALQLDANNADAWLWNGIILRKLNRNAEARKAFERSLSLDPGRVWTRQMLDKTAEK